MAASEREEYYSMLGVGRTEPSEAIHDAFRRLAKRYHPDHAGEQGTRKFQQIQEAYEVLSDTCKRRQYDAALAQKRDHRLASAEPLSRQGHGRPYGRTRGSPIAPEPLTGHASGTPFAEDLCSPLAPSRRWRPNAQFDVNVTLSAEEASHGAVIPLRVPLRFHCPWCREFGFPCLLCRSMPTESDIHLRIQLPPGIEDGTIVEVPPAKAWNTTTRPIRLYVTVRPMDSGG